MVILSLKSAVVFTGLAVILAVGAALASAGCSSSHSTAGGRLQVVATTVQVGALARAVAGNDADVKTLIGAGIDPHDFEPGPSDLRAISNAGVILRNGLGLDDWLDRVIKSGGGKSRTVTVTDGIAVRTIDGHPDPHVWQDPINDQVMVGDIATALAKADPSHAADYHANAKAYDAKLANVDKQVRAIIDTIPPANRKMVTDHDAFGYFIARYGLTYVGAVIPSTSTQAESSAKDIAALEELIKKEHVKAIFSEETANPKVSAQIAKDTGAKVIDTLYGDSLGAPGSGADTVDGMILTNARTIAEALK